MAGRIRLPERMELKKSYEVGGEVFKNLLLWKPRVGEAFTVADSSGFYFRARLTGLKKERAELTVFEEMGGAFTGPRITLLQAMPEKERMELIIQKTAEVGVDRIIPFKSSRSISLEEREARQRKAHKWADIALDASKQSRRASIPEVLSYMAFDEALSLAKNADIKLVCWERHGISQIKEVLGGLKDCEIGSAAVLCGPEGGFEDAEVDEALVHGFTCVSLGANILRTETAPIVAVGILRYELG